MEEREVVECLDAYRCIARLLEVASEEVGCSKEHQGTDAFAAVGKGIGYGVEEVGGGAVEVFGVEVFFYFVG